MTAATVLVLLLSVAPSSPVQVRVGIAGIHDGDTLTVVTEDWRVCGRRSCVVRLAGVDAPELAVRGRWNGQPGGIESLEAAALLCGRGRDAMIRFAPTQAGSCPSSYGRCVASIMCGTQDLALMLVRGGHAWVWPATRIPERGILKEAERQARRERRGLWKAGTSPAPPWKWRGR